MTNAWKGCAEVAAKLVNALSLLACAVVLAAAPARAQDMPSDDPSPPAEQPEKAEPAADPTPPAEQPTKAEPAADPTPPAEQPEKAEPAADPTPPVKIEEVGEPVKQNNAGSFIGTIHSGGETHVVTQTETTTTTVRVGNGGGYVAPPPVRGGPGGNRWNRPGGSGDTAADLAGEWSLLTDGEMGCKVTMINQSLFGGWKARTKGCQKDFFHVNRWEGGQGEIRFTDAFNNDVAQLTRTGRDRFEGVLRSNGARIVLTR